MARQTTAKDLKPVLDGAASWIKSCLIENGSVFSSRSLWTPELLAAVHHAFVDHPDEGDDDFLTKLKGQMAPASPDAKRLMSELLWALLLFPSGMKPNTKRQQIRALWALSGEQLPEDHPALSDGVLSGIGSGGPGFNNHRAREMEYLIGLAQDIKGKAPIERSKVFGDYDAFIGWIETAPQKGHRQYRHMLRFFAFPDRVERISSNNDRWKILEAFGIAAPRVIHQWSDRQLDTALYDLRSTLQAAHPTAILDFYEPPLREKWAADRKVITPSGAVPITVPDDEEDQEEGDAAQPRAEGALSRQSIAVQALLAEIGALMGFTIWIPANDRVRVAERMMASCRESLTDKLPLNYNSATMGTVSQIDVLWLKKQTIVRAFEVEHTTAVYSGLLRMADLLALQPNLKINLHIVAPDERRDKVFREMLRPVFTYLDAGPLFKTCSFLSYESVRALRALSSLAHTHDTIIDEYEEKADEEAS